MKAPARPFAASLVVFVTIGCAKLPGVQRPATPRSEVDTLVALALDTVAGSQSPLLLYAQEAQVPSAIFGPERLRSLMRAAPEVDSLLATQVFAPRPQPPQPWQGVLSLPRPVRWVNDSLLKYWRQSTRGDQEFRRMQAGHAVVYAVARPVIDPSGKVAVVYVENLCSPVCDSGRAFVFVRDQQAHWVPRRVVLSWES